MLLVHCTTTEEGHTKAGREDDEADADDGAWQQ